MSYNDLTAELADYLERQEIGRKGRDIFIERLPREPAQALMIESTGGHRADMLGCVFATFRLLARSPNEDPRPALDMLMRAFDALHGFCNERFNDESGLWIIRCMAVQSAPTNVGRDDNNRQRFSQNYEVEFDWE